MAVALVVGLAIALNVSEFLVGHLIGLGLVFGLFVQPEIALAPTFAILAGPVTVREPVPVTVMTLEIVDVLPLNGH